MDGLTFIKTDDADLRALASGEWTRYRESPSLRAHTDEAHAICARIGEAYFSDKDEAMRLFHALVPGACDGVEISPPILIDYGRCLIIGNRTFINSDFRIVGGGPVVIGQDVLIGPRCAIYTPNHAEDAVRRREGWERTAPVVIEDNVWLGGSVVITQGVRIGQDSIVGAGSVVTRDVPAGVVAVGNPCRPLRDVSTADSLATGH